MGHMEIPLSVFILTLIGSGEAVCVNHSDFAHCVTLPAPFHSDYYFTSGAMTLPQAAQFCEITHAKHLVFFETQREQADLKDKIRNDNGYIWPSLLPEQFWIGSSFHNLKSYWTFWDQMKGKEMEFRSWQNGHESKAAGKVYFPIGWYKVDPDEQYAVICEEESNMADVLQNLQPFYPTSGTTGPVPTTPAESLGTTQLDQQTTFRPIKARKKATNTSQLCPTQPLTVRHILVKLTSLEVDCGWTRPSSSLTQCVAECLSVEACCGLAYTLSGGMCCGLVHGKSAEALRVDCETDICYRFVSQ